MRKGSFWRVRVGSRVSVYNDHWLPRPSSFKGVSSKNLSEHSVVAYLTHEGGRWKKGLTRESFVDKDGKAITNLCLSSNRQDDELVWSYNDKGVYTVKSRFHLTCNVATSEEASGSEAIPLKSWLIFLAS